MRIDLHCHTKKTKQGDAETRNVSVDTFVETLSKNEVQFVAITNHNEFDKNQYEQFRDEALKKEIHVWPGIELDVNVDGEKGHMLVICNPNDYCKFSEELNSLINNVEPDKVIIDIKDLVSKIENLDVLIIAHHSFKDHGFSDKSIEKIKEEISNKKPLMFEPSSLKTVGIMYANGINGFIGSDVSNWDRYPVNKIPTLKMDIKDYNTFILLIKKDPNTINTFINQKAENTVSIRPFSSEGDSEELNLKIYNDVNIIFGGKGTGKSKIIESLCEYYNSKFGTSNVKYYPAQTKESEYNKLVKRKIKKEYFDILKISDCKADFKKLRVWQNTNITSMQAFYKGHHAKNASSNFKKFGFRTATFSDMLSSANYYLLSQKFNKITEAIDNLLEQNVDKYLTESEFDTLNTLLNKIRNDAYSKLKEEWINYKALELEKYTIDIMKVIATAKTGNTSIPSSVGFSEFCTNIFEINKCAKRIYDSFNSSKAQKKEYIVSIADKGNIFLMMDVYINPYEQTGVEYQNDKPNVSSLKLMYDMIKNIYENTFKTDVSEYISKFNKECANNCSSLMDCFGIKTYTSIINDNENDKLVPYSPSSGEKSMLLLHNVLIDSDKSVYILDEPELSVGHKYINDIIVPRLKELAKLDKIIIVSTHDANIAVRTLPLMTIYREYKKTYIGNLFIDELVEIKNNNKVKWTEKSMTYLEGGDFAFKERGNSYGI